MKKLVLGLGIVSIVMAVFFACSKEQPVGNTSAKMKESANEKSNNCSCSANGYWSSCSIECPIKNGICTAHCTTTMVSVMGLPCGSGAVCTCGTSSVGSGRLIVGPEVYFDDVNSTNLLDFKSMISGQTSTGFVHLKASLADLLDHSGDADGSVRADKFNAFLTDLYDLSEEEAAYISPKIKALAEACGRN